MDNMDPRIRPGDSHGKPHNAPGNVVSFKGKPLVVEPGLQEAKASTWSSVIDLISTPLHALRKAFSSKPYSKLSFGNLFQGQGEHLTLKRESLKDALQALGHSMRHGKDDEGRTLFLSKSWGLDYHLRDEFLSKKDGLAQLGHFRDAVEKELYGHGEKKGLYQQYKEALASAKENPSFATAVKDLEEQIAGAEILLKSHDNIVARELFWDVSDTDIFNKIPLEKFLDVLPEDSQHHDLLDSYLIDHKEAGKKPASVEELDAILGKPSRKNDWAFNGNQLLGIMPDKAIAEVLYAKSPHQAQALLAALPKERREDIKEAFSDLVLRDPETGALRDPLVLAESILRLSDLETLKLQPEKTLLEKLASGLSPQESVEAGTLVDAQSELDSAKEEHAAAQAALKEASGHNSAVMKLKADTAALSMIETKLSAQRKDLEAITQKDLALQEKYKGKSAQLAALKISESSNPDQVKRLEKEVNKLRAEVDKIRAQRDKIGADVEASDQRAQKYRDAIAVAPAGDAHSKETINGLKAAVEAADVRVQAAEASLTSLEAQQATGSGYNDILVLTLVNLVSMLPAGDAEKLVTALTLNPDIKIDQNTLENLDAIIEERVAVQDVLHKEALLMRQAEEESLSGNPIVLKDGTKLDDGNVAEVMGSFVKANKVDLNRPVDPDKHLVAETKRGLGELLRIQGALQRPIENVEHMLFLCDEAIAMEKELGGRGSKGLQELQRHYREQHYGLKILEKSVQLNIAQEILGPQARPESLQRLGAEELADKLETIDDFKTRPALYMKLIGGVCGTAFAQELAEALTGFGDAGDLLRPGLVGGPAGAPIRSQIRDAVATLPEAIPYEGRALSDVDLSNALGKMGLDLGEKHRLKPQYIAYEMRRIAEEDISTGALQRTLSEQLEDETALVAYSKAINYAQSLEAFVTRLEVIAEDAAKVDGKASESMLKSLAGYKHELEGARRFEAALKNIAFPASIEEILEDFTIIDGVAQAAPAAPAQDSAARVQGALPITLFGKNLETMDDKALIARLSAHVSINELSIASDKSAIEYVLHEGVDAEEAIEALTAKQETFEVKLEGLRKDKEVKTFLGDQKAYANETVEAQKLSQAVQALRVLINQINIAAGRAVPVESPEIEEIVPVTVKLDDAPIDKSNEADRYRDIRLKYQSLPEGTEPTFEDLGIAIEDDLGHSALKNLQKQLAFKNYRENHALNDAWENNALSEEDIILMSEAYSGLTILHRAVANEMEKLKLDYVGGAIDIWNFKPQASKPIDAGVGG